MASENETVQEILKELRRIKGGQHTNGGLSFERWRARCQFADDYADRIESAWRREKAELVECLKEAVDFHCGKCINKGGPCNKDCLFDRWNKVLKSANAPVAEGGES